jgi:glycine hydroxymethyltransferase
MLAVARCLAERLAETGTPLFAADAGFTASHQFAMEAAAFGGGRTAAQRLRRANILTCGVSLPSGPVGEDVAGVRIGTPEIVRWGMTEEHMGALAAFIVRALQGAEDPQAVAADVTAFRKPFDTVRYVV